MGLWRDDVIDVARETVTSLTEAAKWKRLPRRRQGKRPHVSTIYRWATAGVAGVKLETIRVGGTLCTSLEALQRFFERLSGTDAVQTVPTRRRQQQIARAEAELTEAGIT